MKSVNAQVAPRTGLGQSTPGGAATTTDKLIVVGAGLGVAAVGAVAGALLAPRHKVGWAVAGAIGAPLAGLGLIAAGCIAKGGCASGG